MVNYWILDLHLEMVVLTVKSRLKKWARGCKTAKKVEAYLLAKSYANLMFSLQSRERGSCYNSIYCLNRTDFVGKLY